MRPAGPRCQSPGRRCGDRRRTDVMTYLGEYFRVRLAGALTPAAAARMARLHPGVDAGTFRPDPEARPVIRDALRPRRAPGGGLRVPPRRSQGPGHAPARVAGGHQGSPTPPSSSSAAARTRRPCTSWPRARGYHSSITFTGPVPQAELPAHYAAGDVFAMPCRTRRGGLDVEGLGIVYLEASATGLPVIGGDSGGAPDAHPGRRERLRGRRPGRRGPVRPPDRSPVPTRPAPGRWA